MILVLHQHSHHHHHGHTSKQHGPAMAGVTREVESVGGTAEMNPNVRIKKHTNINVRAAFIHVIGDLFQSIGVVVAAYIIRFKVHNFLLHRQWNGEAGGQCPSKILYFMTLKSQNCFL